MFLCLLSIRTTQTLVKQPVPAIIYAHRLSLGSKDTKMQMQTTAWHEWLPFFQPFALYVKLWDRCWCSPMTQWLCTAASFWFAACTSTSFLLWLLMSWPQNSIFMVSWFVPECVVCEDFVKLILVHMVWKSHFEGFGKGELSSPAQHVCLESSRRMHLHTWEASYSARGVYLELRGCFDVLFPLRALWAICRQMILQFAYRISGLTVKMREAYSSRALCLMLPPQTQNCRQTDGTSMESALRNASHHHWCPCGTCSLWHLWQLCTKPCFLEAVIYMRLGESCQMQASWMVNSIISKTIEDSWKLKRGHLSSIIMRTIGGIFKCCIIVSPDSRLQIIVVGRASLVSEQRGNFALPKEGFPVFDAIHDTINPHHIFWYTGLFWYIWMGSLKKKKNPPYLNDHKPLVVGLPGSLCSGSPPRCWQLRHGYFVGES